MIPILLIIIRYCLYFALFTPIFVSGKFVFPYVFPKTALFQILIEIAFAAWLILIAANPAYRPKFRGLTKTLVIWLAVLFFVSLIGINFYHSFWSSYERMTGLVTLLHYFAYFLILLSILKTENDWIKMFDVAIAAGLCVNLIGLMQKYGGLMSPAGDRIASSFGNPSFLAAYLIFNIFLIVFLFYKKYKFIYWRFYYLFALFFGLLILYWTGTRGAVLALIATSFIFAILTLIAPQKYLSEFNPNFIKKLKICIIIGLVCFVGFIAAFLLVRGNEKIMSKLPAEARRLTLINLTDATTQTRLISWKMAFRGWKDRFWFGWGWENYNVVFNKYYDPALYPTETWFDKAHNIIFDTVTTSGLIGLLAYLAIFFVCFRVLWRGFFAEKINFFTSAIFGVLLITYIVQNLFVFDMIHSYLPFFMILAFIAFIDSHLIGENIAPNSEKLKKKDSSSFVKISVVLGLIFSVYLINIKPAMASLYTIEALQGAMNRVNAGLYSQDKIIGLFSRALNRGTFGQWENGLRLSEYTLDLSALAGQKNDKEKESFALELKKMFDFSTGEMEKIIRTNPSDARYQLMLGSLYMHSSEYDGTGLFSAEKSLAKALELNPGKPDILIFLSQVEINLGNQEKAEALLEKVVILNPKSGYSYWVLGLYKLLVGNSDEGKAAIKKATSLGYVWSDNLERTSKLIGLYEKNKLYADLEPLYLRAIELDPNNADWHSRLANIYFELGENDKAALETAMAIKINPSIGQGNSPFGGGLPEILPEKN